MTPLRANSMLILAALFWGLSNVLHKTVLEDLGPLTTTGLRCLIAAVVLFPFALRECAGPLRIPRGDACRVLHVAVLFTAAIATLQAAYSGTTVTNASFLIGTMTVFTPLVSWLILRCRPTLSVWAAVAFAFTGSTLMIGGSASVLAPGDFACLLSAAIYAIWCVKLGQVVHSFGKPLLVTLAQFGLAGGLCLILGLAFESASAANLMAALPDLLFLGVFGTGLAYALQAAAQKYATASAAATLTSAESIFGAMTAAVVLGERLLPVMWAGAALVVIAIMTVQLSSRTQPGTALQPRDLRPRSHRVSEKWVANRQKLGGASASAAREPG